MLQALYYMTEEQLNEIVWNVLRQMPGMADQVKEKMVLQKEEDSKKSFVLAEILVVLQREKEKCETDRFANVDQFMAGTLDKEIYQRRRADLNRIAEHLDQEIADVG